jgi:putative FmdB family regulatory protein
MPIYEYVCTKCNTEFELRFSFSDANCTPLCPKCYSAVERLTSSFACKTGGNIQAAEKPFRQESPPKKGEGKKATVTSPASNVFITPPPNQMKLLAPPRKKSVRPRRKKK